MERNFKLGINSVAYVPKSKSNQQTSELPDPYQTQPTFTNSSFVPNFYASQASQYSNMMNFASQSGGFNYNPYSSNLPDNLGYSGYEPNKNIAPNDFQPTWKPNDISQPIFKPKQNNPNDYNNKTKEVVKDYGPGANLADRSAPKEQTFKNYKQNNFDDHANFNYDSRNNQRNQKYGDKERGKNNQQPKNSAYGEDYSKDYNSEKQFSKNDSNKNWKRNNQGEYNQGKSYNQGRDYNSQEKEFSQNVSNQNDSYYNNQQDYYNNDTGYENRNKGYNNKQKGGYKKDYYNNNQGNYYKQERNYNNNDDYNNQGRNNKQNDGYDIEDDYFQDNAFDKQPKHYNNRQGGYQEENYQNKGFNKGQKGNSKKPYDKGNSNQKQDWKKDQNFKNEQNDNVFNDFEAKKTFKNEKNTKGNYKNKNQTFESSYQKTTDYNQSTNYNPGLEEEDYAFDQDEGFNEEDYTTEYSQFDYGEVNEKAMLFKDNQCFSQMVDSQIEKLTNFPNDKFVNVLMVAEKPSIARSIADALSNGYKTKKAGRGQVVIEYAGKFGNCQANFTVTSVMGHVYGTDFEKKNNNWSAVDEIDLFNLPTAKIESNPKSRIPSLLSKLANGKDIIVLWLDCDREGENICYEVLHNCFNRMKPKKFQQVYRTKFSSITKPDIKKAFETAYAYPSLNESAAVDLRQVIDLKIGVAFTRFLTTNVSKVFPELAENLLSYGPCQTPTLWFCVNREIEISRFVPKEYYKLYIEVDIKGTLHVIYFKDKFWDETEALQMVSKLQREDCKLVKISKKESPSTPPMGLNTIKLLQTASSFKKIGPKQAMTIAEGLYTRGLISYPRTETTKYANSFDFDSLINEFSSNSRIGKYVSQLKGNFQRLFFN